MKTKYTAPSIDVISLQSQGLMDILPISNTEKDTGWSKRFNGTLTIEEDTTEVTGKFPWETPYTFGE